MQWHVHHKLLVPRRVTPSFRIHFRGTCVVASVGLNRHKCVPSNGFFVHLEVLCRQNCDLHGSRHPNRCMYKISKN
ncbi:hypothetical protein HKD37_03G006317 [Glycine soja]